MRNDRRGDRAHSHPHHEPPRRPWQWPTPHLLATAALLALGLLPTGLAAGMPLRICEALRRDLPNRSDYERMEHGYYERLLDTGRQLDDLAADTPRAEGAIAGHGEPVVVEHGRLTLSVPDVREYILKPNLDRDPGRNIPWATNRHGMRDRDYALAKPPATVRLALVGDSIAAGWAVGDQEGFEPRLEQALDARSRAAGGPAVEVLNFAVPGHGPGQRWSHFATVGWGFTPDLVLYEATTADIGWDERRLRGLLARGVGFDAPVYRAALQAAGARPGLDAGGYKRLLKSHRQALLAGVYQAVIAECRAHGVPAVFVLIPRVGKPVEPADRDALLAQAHTAGFAAVIDATDAFDGLDPRSLAIGPHDFHPNAEGHARLARRLLPALAARPELALRALRSSQATATTTLITTEGVGPR